MGTDNEMIICFKLRAGGARGAGLRIMAMNHLPSGKHPMNELKVEP